MTGGKILIDLKKTNITTANTTLPSGVGAKLARAIKMQKEVVLVNLRINGLNVVSCSVNIVDTTVVTAYGNVYTTTISVRSGDTYVTYYLNFYSDDYATIIAPQ